MIAPLGAFVWTGLMLGRAGVPSAPAPAPAAAPGQPVLTVEQKMPEAIDPGYPFRVDVILHNQGSGPADELVVTDAVPPGYEFLDAAPAPEPGPGSLVWRRQRLEAGESWSLQVHLRAVNGEAEGPPRNAVDVAFRARAAGVCIGQLRRAELALSATVPDAAQPGRPAVLRITVANKGPGAVRRATLRAILPDGLTGAGGADLETDLGALKPGETRVVALEVTAARAGDFRCRVSVDGDAVRPAEQAVLLHAADTRLSVDARGPATMRKDLTGLFELTVRNDGTADARQVGLSVSVPNEMAFVKASDNGVYDSLTHVIRWEMGDLRGGESRSVAWNGTAWTAGDVQGLVRVTAGRTTQREGAWTTRVVQGTAPQPASPARGPKE